ncbi:MAG: DUF3370 domain-containing protein [Leptolyngbyaceae cyanobacterium bins.59]|nr:DUF3370 domain-containing protein [Leptolyngbyaceae cyanobacterium bins.59]
MFPFLAQVPVTPPTPPPKEIVQFHRVRVLPGELDAVPVFNSNSPELVQTEGILLSTFPPGKMRVPTAHLDFAFNGRFDVFAHHIAKPQDPTNLRTLYLGVLLHNPGDRPVTVDILQAASYLSQPDAPFIDLPAYVPNAKGTVYAGPGSRAMSDVLRGKRQAEFPAQVVIPPGESRMVMNLPIPVRELQPPLNGRSSLMRLRTNGAVYAASLAQFAKDNPDGTERPPTLAEWQTLLETGELALPRDRTPTPPEQSSGAMIYGRVAGVAQGSKWSAYITDDLNSARLTIPKTGAFSYGLSTLARGTLGTEQVQTATMLRRYPDTAYAAHGNYAIEYSLTLPLQNTDSKERTVALLIQTPIKQDQLRGGIRFLDPPARNVFFRGTVRVRYTDDRGLPQTLYTHLVQRRGQQGEPLITMKMKSGEFRLVQVDFLYPPDATPPQVLTIQTLY